MKQEKGLSFRRAARDQIVPNIGWIPGELGTLLPLLPDIDLLGAWLNDPMGERQR